MRPGDRVDLIKKVTEKLNQEEWPMLDLILRQFSLPTSDGWNGDKVSYILQMIESADEKILQELAGYFGIGSQNMHLGNVPDFWEKGLYRLFISHRSEDKVEVSSLQKALTCCGISAFVAHEDIEPSREWQEQIELALRTCDGLLAYLKPEFHISQWTDQEVGFALARGVRVIPLERGMLPYGFMGKYQALRTGPLSDIRVAVEILRVVASDPRSGTSFAALITDKLEKSPDFGTSSMCMTALESLPLLGPQELSGVRSAYQANNQFSGVFGMHGRVGRLFEKFKQPWS